MPLNRRTALAFALTLAALPAFAQSPTTRLRGTLVSLEGQTLTMKERSGETVTVKLADTYGVTAVKKGDMADVKPGTFIGVVGQPMTGDRIRALVIQILPDSAKASGGGHFAWDLTPGSTMTNATASETVKSVDGDTIKLTYKDGEKVLVVPPDVVVTSFLPATKEELKPGIPLTVAAMKQPDGSYASMRVLIGRDGFVPPS